MSDERRNREVNINFRTTPEEREMLFRVAADRGMGASKLLRHWIVEAHAARFGVVESPEPPKARSRRRSS